MSEAFAASVRALQLPDDTAMVKAMSRGELEARVRASARVEAAAPADLSKKIRHSDQACDYTARQAEAARDAGNETLARSAAALAAAIGAQGEQMRIAQAARDEWAEGTASEAEAAGAARAELGTRGTPRWDEPKRRVPAAEAAEVQAVDPAQAERWRTAQAELADLIREENWTLDRTPQAEREALPDSLGYWMEQRVAELAQAEEAAEAEAGAWPEARADVQAGLEAEATATKAEADQDPDLEI